MTTEEFPCRWRKVRKHSRKRIGKLEHSHNTPIATLYKISPNELTPVPCNSKIKSLFHNLQFVFSPICRILPFFISTIKRKLLLVSILDMITFYHYSKQNKIKKRTTQCDVHYLAICYLHWGTPSYCRR